MCAYGHIRAKISQMSKLVLMFKHVLYELHFPSEISFSFTEEINLIEKKKKKKQR